MLVSRLLLVQYNQRTVFRCVFFHDRVVTRCHEPIGKVLVRLPMYKSLFIAREFDGDEA